MTHFVVTAGILIERTLGTYPTVEAAINAHDGLWFERFDRSGRRYWWNQRAKTWGAPDDAPTTITEAAKEP